MSTCRLAAIVLAREGGSAMSAVGQLQTSVRLRLMSAFHPKADVPSSRGDVCLVPNADTRHVVVNVHCHQSRSAEIDATVKSCKARPQIGKIWQENCDALADRI